jgi:tetratricopeptide (TPR) repeat protein
MRKPTPLLALGVFLTAIITYALTLPQTLSFWDCGEYIATSHILGIPHQPGTPLYVLMGRTFDVLLSPFVSTAVAVNFMSAFFSALTVMFLYLVIAKVARKADPDSGWLPHAGGVTGAFFLLYSETFWNNAIEAEVYGLSGFVLITMTWLALKWYDVRERAESNKIVYLMVYILGLGVGFHLGSLLVYPGIFLLMLFANRRRFDLIDLFGISFALALFMLSTMIKDDFILVSAMVILLAVAAVRSFGRKPVILVSCGIFMLGLSVHLFMLIRAGLDPAINQTQPDTFATLMTVLRREQYPPINPFERKADLVWQIGYYYNYLLDQFTFLSFGGPVVARVSVFVVPIFLALLGVVHSLTRIRRFGLMLLVNYLINADVLNFYLNFSDHEVRERDYFFFAGFLFFTIFIGLGATALPRYIAGPLGAPLRALKAGEKIKSIHLNRPSVVVAGMLVLLSALPMLSPWSHAEGGKWFHHDRTENLIAREYAWNLLAGLDPGAVIFTNGDNDTFPLWYLQEVEGVRQDVRVINLALVNLPWYNKQIKRAESPAPISYSDGEIDELRPVAYEDPKTGEREVLWVRDYIVHDILQNAGDTPVFFAVTIPQENMSRYFDMLSMEGLAYRFTGKKSGTGMPSVDPQRMLANMYGIYDYSSTLDGDTDARRQQFAEQNKDRAAASLSDVALADEVFDVQGLWGAITNRNGGVLQGDPVWDVSGLADQLGRFRSDYFVDINADNLMGNYPAGLIRAGYELLIEAQQVPESDNDRYLAALHRSEAAFALASRFDPTFPMVADVYPLVLIELKRSDEAIEHLDSIAGRIPPRDEIDALYQAATAMTSLGEAALADTWISRRLTAEPDQQALYQLLFKIRRSVDDLNGCRQVHELWRTQFGQTDPEMVRAIEEMAAGATNPTGQ